MSLRCMSMPQLFFGRLCHWRRPTCSCPPEQPSWQQPPPFRQLGFPAHLLCPYLSTLPHLLLSNRTCPLLVLLRRRACMSLRCMSMPQLFFGRLCHWRRPTCSYPPER